MDDEMTSGRSTWADGQGPEGQELALQRTDESFRGWILLRR